MEPYTPEVEHLMQRLHQSLSEKDRRRYAAVESAKLGHGGLNYISQILDCDPKTIHAGLVELKNSEVLETTEQRKKGLGGNG